MRALTDAELLRVWESGAGETPGNRALLMLELADAGVPADRLGIASRDRLLLEFRARTFGPVLPCLATCPACGQQLAFDVPIAELAGPDPAGFQSAVVFTHESFEVEGRSPTCADLAAVVPAGDAYDLARHCLTSVRSGGIEVDPAHAPTALLDRLDAELAGADPDLPITIALSCPRCDAVWEPPFDAPNFLWAEVATRALRLLREVDRLATAYHWGEAEILRLGSRRREYYLALVGA